MCRLIWGFAGRTYHIVGNLISQLISFVFFFRFFMFISISALYFATCIFAFDMLFALFYLSVCFPALYLMSSIILHNGIFPSASNCNFFSLQASLLAENCPCLPHLSCFFVILTHFRLKQKEKMLHLHEKFLIICNIVSCMLWFLLFLLIV